MLSYSASIGDGVDDENDPLWSHCSKVGSLFDAPHLQLYDHFSARPELRLEMHNPAGQSRGYYLRFACTHCNKHTQTFQPHHDPSLDAKAKSSKEVKNAYLHCINYNLGTNYVSTTCRHRTGSAANSAPTQVLAIWHPEAPPPHAPTQAPPEAYQEPPPPPPPPGSTSASQISSEIVSSEIGHLVDTNTLEAFCPIWLFTVESR